MLFLSATHCTFSDGRYSTRGGLDVLVSVTVGFQQVSCTVRSVPLPEYLHFVELIDVGRTTEIHDNRAAK